MYLPHYYLIPKLMDLGVECGWLDLPKTGKATPFSFNHLIK